MSNTLTKIERLAQQFTRDLVDSLRGASIDELVGLSGKRAAKSAAPKSAASKPATPEAEAPKRRGRPPKNSSAAPAVKKPASASKGGKAEKKDDGRTRRSGDELVQIQAKVVKYINANQKDAGLAVSEIAKGVKLEVEEITRALVKAVASGQVKKTGEKRLTRYFPGDASAPDVEAPPASGPTATTDAEGAQTEATG